MSYHDTVKTLAGDPEQLEQVYQTAVKASETAIFEQAIDDSYHAAPDNVLYAAWFYRLKTVAAQAKDYVVAWSWVLPLAIINGLLFWWLSGQRFMITTKGLQGAERDFVPTIILLAAPLAAIFVLTYLTVIGHKRWYLSAIMGALLLAAGAYVLWSYPRTGAVPFQEQYINLMAMHLPLLAWAGVGILLIADHRDPVNRFSFMIKSLEVFILGGLFVMAGGLFTAITIGLFDALNVAIPELWLRLFIAGGAGLIPVVASAVIYNPAVPPANQAFGEGLSKLVALLMRLMLPLTLLVLLIYLAFIPFNWSAPFDKRDVLIIYNGMLFAVVALLVGATPISLANVAPRLGRWLRRGIIAVTALALLVSLYALAAILYRTALDRLTPNRLAFIGWNVVNIALLALVLLFQRRAKEGNWLQRLYRAYSIGTVLYTVWTLALILAIPWMFGIDQGAIGTLPESVQELVYEQPAPILLKCTSSPNIYLLERGQKRWINNLQTFSDRGYVWRDVNSISCDDLGSIPDGVPIPADAGSPPQP